MGSANFNFNREFQFSRNCPIADVFQNQTMRRPAFRKAAVYGARTRSERYFSPKCMEAKDEFANWKIKMISGGWSQIGNENELRLKQGIHEVLPTPCLVSPMTLKTEISSNDASSSSGFQCSYASKRQSIGPLIPTPPLLFVDKECLQAATNDIEKEIPMSQNVMHKLFSLFSRIVCNSY